VKELPIAHDGEVDIDKYPPSIRALSLRTRWSTRAGGGRRTSFRALAGAIRRSGMSVA